jgi:hypothetical protein
VDSECRAYLKADVVICSVCQLHRARDLLLCLDCENEGKKKERARNQRDNEAKIPSTFLYSKIGGEYAGESVSRHTSNSPNPASENNTQRHVQETLN